MTQRKEHLLGLLHRTARIRTEQLGTQVKALKDKEFGTFELEDRIGRVLAQSDESKASLSRAGELLAAHFMGRTLVQQLEETRAKRDALGQERAARESDLRDASMRTKILEDRRSDTARANRVAREAAEDAKLSATGKRRAPQGS